MKKLLLILLFSFGICFAQDWSETYDVWNDLDHTVQSEDSVYMNSGGGIDSLLFIGLDTTHIFIPIKDSQGGIRIWGVGTRRDTLTGLDTLFFDIAKHSGDGAIAYTNFTPTYYRVDTLSADSASYGQFDINVMDNSNMQAETWNFVDLRIISRTGFALWLYIKIEWLETK